MPVTVILVVGAEAAGVSACDGRLGPGGDSLAEPETHRKRASSTSQFGFVPESAPQGRKTG